MNMKPLLLLLALCGGLAGPSPAAHTIPSTSASKAAADGGRFLFVVKTSSSMRRIETATRQAVFDMIFTGLNGYMRSGDSLGLWTFNEETQAGEFPMQVWEAESPMDAATRAASHLRAQRYSGDADTAALILKLQSVIGAVRNVTIFIVMDAGTKFEGTPFDEAVNSTIQQQAREQARARKPFITALVAREGKIADAFVTIAGQPMTLPERPVSAPVQKSAPPAALADPKATTTPAPQRAKILEFVTKTNPPTPVIGSNPAAPAVVAVKTPSAPQPELVVTQHAALIITNTPKATNENMASAVARVEPPPSTPAPASSPAYSPPPEPVPKAATPAPAALLPKLRRSVSARELLPQPIEAQVPVAAPVQPMQAAAVLPQPGLSPMVLLIIGGLLLASALFLIAVVLRRLRPAPQPSFISQSMDRR